jgi:hypothetical protein
VTLVNGQKDSALVGDSLVSGSLVWHGNLGFARIL